MPIIALISEKFVQQIYEKYPREIIAAHENELVEQLYDAPYSELTKAMILVRIPSIDATHVEKLLTLSLSSNDVNNHLVPFALASKYPESFSKENKGKLNKISEELCTIM